MTYRIMNTESIIAGLKSVADPARKAASKTMFPTSMKNLDVRNPEMKKYDEVLAGRVRRKVYTKLNTGRKNG